MTVGVRCRWFRTDDRQGVAVVVCEWEDDGEEDNNIVDRRGHFDSVDGKVDLEKIKRCRWRSQIRDQNFCRSMS